MNFRHYSESYFPVPPSISCIHALNVILKIKTTCNKCFSDFPYEAMMDSNILVDFIIVPTCKR
jgi:hypothetical protein